MFLGYTEINSLDFIACIAVVLLSQPRLSVWFWDLRVPLPKCRSKYSRNVKAGVLRQYDAADMN